MKILNLALRGLWYDMIDYGGKKEDYREVKPYWIRRLCITSDLELSTFKDGGIDTNYTHVRFRKGLTEKTMLFKLNKIIIGIGNLERGAPDKRCFIIKLGDRITED